MESTQKEKNVDSMESTQKEKKNTPTLPESLKMASSDAVLTLADLSPFKDQIDMVKSKLEECLSELREKPETYRVIEEVKHLIKLEDHLRTVIKYRAQIASVSLTVNELTTNKAVVDAVDDITHTLASLNNEFSVVLLNGKFDALSKQKMKVEETSKTIRDHLSKILHKEGEDERANTTKNSAILHTYFATVCKVAQVGTWGTKEKGSDHNHWHFRLENNQKLKKISIDHGDLIFSLKFTTEDGKGCLHESKKAGGWNGGHQECEVTFDSEEDIIGISGTVGVSTGKYAGYTIISSLSFITNKRTHGPFGQATGTPFDVPWNRGSFAGFYGLAGYYIDCIGVYLKASQETARVGLWGTECGNGPQYRWSFCLERNYKLTKITIGIDDMISSLMFTSEDYTGSVHVSKKAGGYIDASTISEINLAWDEEIIGIEGTYGVSAGSSGVKKISSLSFVTNKRNHGPFGCATGIGFTVPWSKGSFAGFYGTANYYIDGIGVYLRPTI